MGAFTVVVATQAFSATINILTNGSFEIPSDASTNNYDLRNNATLLNGWTYNPKASQVGVSGVNGFVPPDYFAYPGQFSTPYGNRWVFFGSGSPNPGGEIIQTVFLEAGLYKASINAKAYGYFWETVSFAFGVFPNIELGGAYLNGTPTVTDNPQFAVWNEYSTYFQVDAPGYVDFVIADATGWGAAPSADLYVDNAVLQLVPEPSSLSLLLVGGLVALAKRRKL